jgi:ribosomal protein S18 acetylase RimI-like enzyme
MRLVDWRELPVATATALLAQEGRWWRSHLGWNLDPAFEDVERARELGRLPGIVVAAEDGRPAAWAFFAADGTVVQIGAMAAATAEAGRLLVRTIVRAAEDVQASAIGALVRPGVPGAAEELTALGFDLETYRYLEAPTAAFREFAPEIRLCIAADLPHLPALFACAYRDSTETRPFAPNGTAAEWEAYVRQLVHTRGCGEFQIRASVVAGGAALEGAALVTALSESTAHLAQVAVAPEARRRGLGRRLVVAAASAARARGLSRITLFVAGQNARAIDLYDGLGFSPTTSFVAAVRRQPRPLISVADATGGASTFR